MDSINKILGDKDFSEPEEITKLKEYIKRSYGENSEIRLSQKGFVIVVGSSALASTLRLNLPEIKRQLAIKDALTIIIR